MFVQNLSFNHLFLYMYLPNMVKSFKVCAQLKSNIYTSQAFMIFRKNWGLITPPTKLLMGSILLFHFCFSQNETLKMLS